MRTQISLAVALTLALCVLLLSVGLLAWSISSSSQCASTCVSLTAVKQDEPSLEEASPTGCDNVVSNIVMHDDHVVDTAARVYVNLDRNYANDTDLLILAAVDAPTAAGPDTGASVITKRERPRAATMRVGIFVQCYNERLMLPWFVRYYRTMLPGCAIHVMDNESDDGTPELARSLGCTVATFSTKGKLDDIGRLRLKERARSYLPDMDWIINVDTDEFVVVNESDLRHERESGTTLLQTFGMNMVAKSESPELSDLDLFALALGTHDPMYSKPAVYSPSHITEMNYDVGCHSAKPLGSVILSTRRYPLYHLHFLGAPYLQKRYRVMNARNDAQNRVFGHQYRWKDAEIENAVNRLYSMSSKTEPLNVFLNAPVTAITPDISALVAHATTVSPSNTTAAIHV